MTAASWPSRICAVSSVSVPSTSFTFRRPANAARSCCEAAVRSSSPKPIVRSLLPPEKIAPNRKMKIRGKASVQNRAARSRTKLRILATVRLTRAFIRFSVPERSTGQIEEDVLERSAPYREVLRLASERLRRREDGPDRCRDVAAEQRDAAVLALER